MKKRLLLVGTLLALLVLTGCGQTPSEYEAYLSPWKLNAAAEAKQTQEMRFYFMAGEGLRMGEESDPEKWGDSCLIVFPDGQTMLIDTGMAAYAPVLVENLHRLGVKKLDYLVISHPHDDHAYGALTEGGILDSFPVGKAFCNGAYNSNWSDPQALEKALRKHDVPWQAWRKGDSLDIGPVHASVLWPTEAEGQTYTRTEDINDSSLVLRFDYGEFSALFTGDIYRTAEWKLLEQDSAALDVDLLKIPHHGNQTSSSADFAAAVSPELAVATGRLAMTTTIYYTYTKNGARVCFDFCDGYISAAAKADGTLTAQTSRARTVTTYDAYDYKG